MKTRRIFTVLLTLGLLLLLVLTVGLSQAQGPESEADPPVTTSGDGAAEPTVAWPSSAPEPTVAAPVSGAGDPTATWRSSAPVESLSSPDQPLAAIESEDVGALQTYSYLRVAGSALRPRGSDVEWRPTGTGACIYASSGDNSRVFNTPVYLPQGATVKRLRMYFDDTNATHNCWGWFTVYDYTGAIEGEWTVTSTGSGGFGYQSTDEFTHTIDYDLYSYVLNWRPYELGSDMQLCGFRIDYYAPPGGAAYLPLVTKDYIRHI
jgi:hypothetical protein